MEVLDIITTVIDLSQKGSEFNEEIASLNITVISLQQAMQHLENAKNILNEAQMHALKITLEEASSLMQKVSKKSNWWQNIKNMLPGSDLN